MTKKKSHNQGVRVNDADKFKLVSLLLTTTESLQFSSIEKFCAWVISKGINMSPAVLTGMMRVSPEHFGKVKLKRDGSTSTSPYTQMAIKVDALQAHQEKLTNEVSRLLTALANEQRVSNMLNDDVTTMKEQIKVMQKQISDLNTLIHS